MSRIQDILAKAERDGTMRRTQTESFRATPAETMNAPSSLPSVEGTSALNPDFSAAGALAAATAVAETRTATATLHPTLVAAIDPHAPIAEQYRAIRARLAHAEEHQSLRILMVTSPGGGDGKSITAANLALTMAQEIQRNVVLVDADLRASSVHSLFGLPRTPGLADVLAGRTSLDEALVYIPELRLTLLPAGSEAPFPTELLGSNAMRRAMDTLRSRFDRVLLDVPAVSPLADAGTVASLADGVVIVVRAGVTQRPALDRAVAAFEEHQVVGVVLNAIP
jgi:capsular exopolysaccharide synthesis family protein